MAGVSSRQPVSGMYNIGKVKLKFRQVKKTRYYGFFLFLLGICILLYSYLWNNLYTRSLVMIPAYRGFFNVLGQIRSSYDQVQDDHEDMGIQFSVSAMETLETTATTSSANAKNSSLHTVVSTTSMRHLIYSQGYVHARERLFQMDVLGRRVATGTLSEVIGKSGVLVDKAMRMWNISGLSDIDLNRLQEDHDAAGGSSETATVLDHLNWYTEGVNAYINSHVTPIDYVSFGVWNIKPTSHMDLIHTVANWTNKDTLALIRYHLLYTADYLHLQDKLLMSALEEVLDISDGSGSGAGVGPFSYLFEKNSGSSGECDSESNLCIPTIGSTAYLASLPGDILYSTDLHEKAVTPSKYMNMELKLMNTDNTVVVRAKGVSVPGIPLIWNNGENDDMMWSLHTSDPFYSNKDITTPLNVDGNTNTSTREEFISVKDKKDGGVHFDVVDSSNPEEDSLVSWMISTNAILSAYDLKKALAKSERMRSELHNTKRLIMHRNRVLNVHNTLQSLYRLNFGTSIDECGSAYDSTFTHVSGVSIATLLCNSKGTKLSPVVYYGNDIIYLSGESSSITNQDNDSKNIFFKKVVVATDFGFNKQAGMHLLNKLASAVVDSTCRGEGTCDTSSSPSTLNTQTVPLTGPISSRDVFHEEDFFHSASGVFLAQVASTHMNGVCSLATRDTSLNSPRRVMQNSKLSISQSAVIRDLLRSNSKSNKQAASYGLDDTAPFFIEHFRLQLYSLLMKGLFNSATLSEKISENLVLDNKIKYFNSLLLADMSVKLYEHGVGAQMSMFVGRCKDIATFYLLKLRAWIRTHLVTVADDPKVVQKQDVVAMDVYRNMLIDGYVGARHSERLSYYSDWYLNFFASVEAGSDVGSSISWYSHVSSKEYNLEGLKETMICQALKNTMDIVERRAELVSDSNIDDYENRAQQYGNAVLSLENKASVDKTIVNEFRSLYKWGLFHTALFTSIFQESYIFREVYTKRLSSPSMAGTMDSLVRTGYAPYGSMHEASTVALKTGYNTRFDAMNEYKRGVKTGPSMYFSVFGGQHSGYIHRVMVDKMGISALSEKENAKVNASVVYNNRYVLLNKEF